MKTRPKVQLVVLAVFALVVASAIGVSVVSLRNSCAFQRSQDQEEASPGQSSLSQETTHVDLEDGVRLKQELRRSGDGEVWDRSSTVTLDGKTVMTELWRKAGSDGEPGWHLRVCLWNGKPLLSESDDNGDGVWDSLVLYKDRGFPVQLFEHGKDGLLLPVRLSANEKRRYIRDYNVVGDALKTIVEAGRKGVTEEEAGRILEDVVRKAKKRMHDQAKASLEEQKNRPQAGP